MNLDSRDRDVPLAAASSREPLLAWVPVTLGPETVSMPAHDVVVLGPERP